MHCLHCLLKDSSSNSTSNKGSENCCIPTESILPASILATTETYMQTEIYWTTYSLLHKSHTQTTASHHVQYLTICVGPWLVVRIFGSRKVMSSIPGDALYSRSKHFRSRCFSLLSWQKGVVYVLERRPALLHYVLRWVSLRTTSTCTSKLLCWSAVILIAVTDRLQMVMHSYDHQRRRRMSLTHRICGSYTVVQLSNYILSERWLGI